MVELDPCVPRSHLPLSCHGRYLALSLVELGLKPLPRVSLHLHSSVPHLTRLACIPSYTPLHVGFAWLWAMQLPGPHGYGRSTGECKEARVKQEEQEKEFLCLRIMYSRFSQACSGSNPNQLYLFQVSLTGEYHPYLTSPSLCKHPSSPLLGPFPCDLQGLGQWFPGKCRVAAPR